MYSSPNLGNIGSSPSPYPTLMIRANPSIPIAWWRRMKDRSVEKNLMYVVGYIILVAWRARIETVLWLLQEVSHPTGACHCLRSIDMCRVPGYSLVDPFLILNRLENGLPLILTQLVRLPVSIAARQSRQVICYNKIDGASATGKTSNNIWSILGPSSLWMK
jgi:hypothetical protein